MSRAGPEGHRIAALRPVASWPSRVGAVVCLLVLAAAWFNPEAAMRAWLASAVFWSSIPIAALMLVARTTTGTSTHGGLIELDVIAAVFIGGASALGGVGQVAGAVIGAFIMGVMNNGMSIMGVNIDWQQMIKGVVLLAAVFFDLYNKNRSA